MTPGLRSRESRLLGRVQHPETYREILIESAGVPIALSVWEPERPRGTVVFVPGTASHPLFYEEFLDGPRTAFSGSRGASPRACDDGSLRIPVTVLTARRDPLFPLAETRATVARLRAPRKELVLLDVACHLVLNEALGLALPAALAALDRLTTRRPGRPAPRSSAPG